VDKIKTPFPRQRPFGCCKICGTRISNCPAHRKSFSQKTAAISSTPFPVPSRPTTRHGFPGAKQNQITHKSTFHHTTQNRTFKHPKNRSQKHINTNFQHTHISTHNRPAFKQNSSNTQYQIPQQTKKNIQIHSKLKTFQSNHFKQKRAVRKISAPPMTPQVGYKTKSPCKSETGGSDYKDNNPKKIPTKYIKKHPANKTKLN